MDQATQSHLAQRQGHVAHWLVWLEARNRDTGAIQPGGFWDGGDHQEFTIGGQTRPYIGAGPLLDVQPIRQAVGLGIRMQSVTLTLLPEVENAIRVYDPGLASVEIHRALFHPGSMLLVAEPELAFAGTVDTTPIDEGAIGQPSTITLEIAGVERALTRTLPLFKSDAAMRARASSDTFRQYAAEVGRWTVPWGEEGQTATSKASSGSAPAAGTPALWGP